MNPQTEFNRTISTAITGLVALGIIAASFVFFAVPKYQSHALKMQEASATWVN